MSIGLSPRSCTLPIPRPTISCATVCDDLKPQDSLHSPQTYGDLIAAKFRCVSNFHARPRSQLFTDFVPILLVTCANSFSGPQLRGQAHKVRPLSYARHPAPVPPTRLSPWRKCLPVGIEGIRAAAVSQTLR